MRGGAQKSSSKDWQKIEKRVMEAEEQSVPYQFPILRAYFDDNDVPIKMSNYLINKTLKEYKELQDLHDMTLPALWKRAEAAGVVPFWRAELSRRRGEHIPSRSRRPSGISQKDWLISRIRQHEGKAKDSSEERLGEASALKKEELPRREYFMSQLKKLEIRFGKLNFNKHIQEPLEASAKAAAAAAAEAAADAEAALKKEAEEALYKKQHEVFLKKMREYPEKIDTPGPWWRARSPTSNSPLIITGKNKNVKFNGYYYYSGIYSNYPYWLRMFGGEGGGGHKYLFHTTWLEKPVWVIHGDLTTFEGEEKPKAVCYHLLRKGEKNVFYIHNDEVSDEETQLGELMGSDPLVRSSVVQFVKEEWIPKTQPRRREYNPRLEVHLVEGGESIGRLVTPQTILGGERRGEGIQISVREEKPDSSGFPATFGSAYDLTKLKVVAKTGTQESTTHLNRLMWSRPNIVSINRAAINYGLYNKRVLEHAAAINELCTANPDASIGGVLLRPILKDLSEYIEQGQRAYDTGLPEGMPIYVEGYGLGIYENFKETNWGAWGSNIHTIAFENGVKAELKLNEMRWAWASSLSTIDAIQDVALVPPSELAAVAAVPPSAVVAPAPSSESLTVGPSAPSPESLAEDPSGPSPESLAPSAPPPGLLESPS